MILRRIVEHMQQQHWTSVFIELLIVVLGVFIGIEAQQWSADRNERQQEHVYLERILMDIRVSIQTDELNISRLTQYSDREYFVVDSLRQCRLPEGDKDIFARGVGDIAKIGPSVFVLSTLKEMISAGHFSIIRSPGVRDALNGLARDADYQGNVFSAIYAQLASATSITSGRTMRIYREHKTPFDPVDWRDMDIDFKGLCADREFQAAVSNVRYLTDAQISLNSRALDKLKAAQKVLRAELGLPAATVETAP